MSKINIALQHYAPQSGDFKNPDKSKIWVILCDPKDDGSWDSLGGGYIANIFPEGYFDAEDGTFKRETVTGVITRTVVKEHFNGGRTNNKVYSSVQEYLEDPSVKNACRDIIVGGVGARIARNGGDPDRVDFVRTFKIDGYSAEFTVSDSGYDSVIPQEWLNEFNSDTITGLSKCGVWPDADSAIRNTESNDDLFGERLFPVLKAPRELSSLMQDICYGFKSYSDPLMDDEFVYIGIRSKTYEIGTIEKIYEAGGWILQYQEWDW